MKQIMQSYKTGEIKLEDVPASLCKSGGVLVKNIASLISVGTEKLMIDTGQKSLVGKALARPDLVRQAYQKAQKEGYLNVFKEALNRLDEPVPLGYSSSGIVVEVGEDVKEFKVGDRVACAGAGYASHAELIWVPENLCVKIPDNVSHEDASFVMLGGIALHGIRLARLTFGENVVIIGLGLIGLLSIQLLSAYGCNVIGIDIDERKLEFAKQFGPDLCLAVNKDDVTSSVVNFTKGFGADAVIITAAEKDNKTIRLAEDICGSKGRIVMVGVAELNLTRKSFWEKELIFTVSKAAGPGSIEPVYEQKGYDYPISYVRWTEKRNFEHFIELISKGRLAPNRLITHKFKIDAALKAYDMIIKNTEPYIGVVIKYDEKPKKFEPKIYFEQTISDRTTGLEKNVGIIGGGLFTKNILLPSLKQIAGVNLAGIATTTGMTSYHIGKKFRANYCTSNYREILNDKSIGSVIITTRHNLHAKMVVEALKSGKQVFVEKPLCITENELEEIKQVYNGELQNKQVLMVGFNRRFSKLAQEAKRFLEGRITPLVVHYRVNAGYIPKEHWTQALDIGGGRIIGEVCHFIDFLQFLTDSYPDLVFVESINGNTGKYLTDDNITITLRFKDGSIGTILYTSQGSKSFSRERVEVFSEDSVIMIDDFRNATFTGKRRHMKTKKWGQDMGYVQEMEYFVNPKSYNPKMFEGYIYTTIATFKAMESLLSGKPIEISL